MGPHQGHGGSGGFPKIHVAFGHIVCVPHLFWQQSCRGGKCLDGLQKGSGAAAGGQFVVAPFARQERPSPAGAPAIVARSIVALAVTVVVIAMTTRAEGVSTFSTASMTFSESTMIGSSGLRIP